MAEDSKKTRKIRPGDVVPARELVALSDVPVAIPDPRQLVHLQFRRFAGCPVCSLHLRSFSRRHQELVGASVREVAVFHSSAKELCAHAGGLPFAVIPDPDKRLYVDFGVESAPRALLDPRAWWPIVRAVLFSVVAILRRRGRPPALVPSGGRFGLPADFLIAQDGRVLACKYGEYVDDQWSVDDVLHLAGAERPAEAPASTPHPAS